jgi:hypothetical protein
MTNPRRQFTEVAAHLGVPTDWVSPTLDAPVQYRAIRVNTAGNVVCQLLDSTADRTLAFAAGETRYGYFTEIKASGTTATGLEAAK